MFGDVRVCDRSTSPSASSSHQVRGSIYHAYNFRLTLSRYMIERLSDPTTSYLCLSNKPKQPCPPQPSKPCSAMLLLLAAQPLLSMHARMLQLLPPVTSWIGISYYYIVVDDMIIIMLAILDEGWKV